MSGAVRAAAAAALGLALALTGAAPAEAQVDMIATGVPGPVSLLTFAGDTETAPTSATDVSQASAECYHNARGRRAVFAGALAWAPDETPGVHNDWAYVRVVAGAVDDEGRARVGEVSPYYPAYDDHAATLPAVGVFLPRDGVTYTPVLTVQFFDSTYRLTGTTMVARPGGRLAGQPADAVVRRLLVRRRRRPRAVRPRATSARRTPATAARARGASAGTPTRARTPRAATAGRRPRRSPTRR